MFLSIYHNQSGDEFIRRLAPNETLDVCKHVEKWAMQNYDAKPIFSRPGALIPNGCGDYQAEIRHTKAESGSCWTCEPFFLESET